MQFSSLILIFLFFLSSCTIDWKDENTTQVQSLETNILSLETENKALKIENKTIKEEINLLKAGWIPSEPQALSVLPQWVSSVSDGSLFPEWTTFEETNSAECYKKAYDTFIAAGTKKCVELGYKDTEIKANKCQLSIEFINELNTKRKDAEAQCGPM